jgi:hypothetical protein
MSEIIFQAMEKIQRDRDQLSRENLELSRLLGMSGEREADLRGKISRLERELAESNAYADKLAAGLPEGMLPKDIELLRNANCDFAQEIDGLRKQIEANLKATLVIERMVYEAQEYRTVRAEAVRGIHGACMDKTIVTHLDEHTKGTIDE